MISLLDLIVLLFRMRVYCLLIDHGNWRYKNVNGYKTSFFHWFLAHGKQNSLSPLSGETYKYLFTLSNLLGSASLKRFGIILCTFFQKFTSMTQAFKSKVHTFTKLQMACSYKHPPFFLWYKKWGNGRHTSSWSFDEGIAATVRSLSAAVSAARIGKAHGLTWQESCGGTSHPLTETESSRVSHHIKPWHILMK